MARCAIILAFLLLATPAGDPLKDFERAWAAAVDDEARETALLALLEHDNATTARLLARLVAHPGLSLRVTNAVAAGLAGLRSDDALQALIEAAATAKDLETRVRLVRALGRNAQEARVPALIELCADHSWQVRSAAYAGLGAVQRREVLEALIARLAEESGRLAGEVRLALRRISGQRLRTPEEWATWWAAQGADYAFPPLEGPQPAAERVRLGDPQSTRAGGDDGGTVYEGVVSERVVFVVDASNSMTVRALEAGRERITRLEYVKRELAAAIERQLSEEARFDIIVFADEVQAWQGKLVKASKANRAAARRFVEHLRTAGETNSMGALDAAFAVKGADTVYFLSDGFPTTGRLTGTDEILEEVQRLNRGRAVVVHAIAFLAGDGSLQGVVEAKDVSRAFMERLAAVGNGTARVIE